MAGHPKSVRNQNQACPDKNLQLCSGHHIVHDEVGCHVPCHQCVRHHAEDSTSSRLLIVAIRRRTDMVLSTIRISRQLSAIGNPSAARLRGACCLSYSSSMV